MTPKPQKVGREPQSVGCKPQTANCKPQILTPNLTPKPQKLTPKPQIWLTYLRLPTPNPNITPQSSINMTILYLNLIKHFVWCLQHMNLQLSGKSGLVLSSSSL
jgi:hypothetical protein